MRGIFHITKYCIWIYDKADGYSYIVGSRYSNGSIPKNAFKCPFHTKRN